MTNDQPANNSEPLDFIRTIIAEHNRTGTYNGQVVTRFPPEPNGYLHIGHAKSIYLNFSLALENGGRCHLRFDDTNPTTEDRKYVDAIQQDIQWLGFDWGEHLYFASDYYEQFYACAVQLIQDGKAYVDSLNEAQIRAYRGSITEPGRESPYRTRSVEENLDLLDSMRAGEFEDGAHILRAKIDMAAPNMKLRDPLLYRIRRHAHHYRTGDRWCIYPMYDYAHPLSDAIEGITHSICTLEFENNRDIYDWVVEHCCLPSPGYPRPHQYEFARLNLEYTVLSKRKLLELVQGGYVSGWDDPRMPTLAGLRRRGVTPSAIRAFCERIGVAKTNSRVELSLFEHAIRDDLNPQVRRVMAVLRPLKVVFTNYPTDQVEEIDAPSYPHDVPKEGSRPVPFGRELYIERDDFLEAPPKDFFRLAPGREVRLRYAYIIKCEEVIKDAAGEISELRCAYDPDSRGVATPDGRKVKGTIHWVSAAHALPAEVRLYDRLFTVPDPDAAEDFKATLNPASVQILQGCRLEPSLAAAPTGERYQFERQGYFVADTVDSQPGALVFNRIIDLRDSWAKATQPDAPAVKPGKAEKPSAVVHNNGKSDSADEGTPRARSEIREQMRAAMPQLAARFTRYITDLGLTHEEADVLTGDPAVADFFEAALAVHYQPKPVANWVMNEVLRGTKEKSVDALLFTGAGVGALVALIDNNTISTTIAKQVFAQMLQTGGEPATIVEQQGLQQVTDASELTAAIERVIAANKPKAEQYRAGKTGLLGFFVGQVMKETGGKANPQMVQELVRRQLS
ncbi:MAG: glutamine--tRNA ligase/YqeY domain fusion protein [Chloroflexota bacterium]|nr:glutamine--tRNA ligase/YqeY domain fusion protein [Chloroflexota bacterium]